MNITLLKKGPSVLFKNNTLNQLSNYQLIYISYYLKHQTFYNWPIYNNIPTTNNSLQIRKRHFIQTSTSPQLTKNIKKGGLTHQTLPDTNKYAPFRYNYVTTIIQISQEKPYSSSKSVFTPSVTSLKASSGSP